VNAAEQHFGVNQDQNQQDQNQQDQNQQGNQN
jgi:hypothetical protein